MKKPRIAIYYHSCFGRNDGPPLYYFNVLKNQMKLDVMHLQPEGDTRKFGKFDYHFWVDYGEDGLPVDHTWTIPKDGGKTIYVCSDAHIDEGGKKYRFNTAKKFDYVFFNQKKFIEEYQKMFNLSLMPFVQNGELIKDTYRDVNPHVVGFLPHAAEPQAYPHFEIVKKYDVAFIGHFQDIKNHNGITRIDALDRLFKEFPNFYFGTRNPQKPEANMFEDASKKFCQAKIVFNISIKDDLNMRLFEVLSSGSFLLTNELPTLGELFTNKKHLVTYNSLDQMVELIHYYLAHDDEREQIANTGHKEFLAGHTYRHRIDHIFKTMGAQL